MCCHCQRVLDFVLTEKSYFYALMYLSPLRDVKQLSQLASKMGCGTSEDLFWKLEALQVFIRELQWPDEVFGKHLEQRLKLMACDMLESSLNRTLHAFQTWEKKSARFGNICEYTVPSEMCVMMNVVLETKNQSLKLCTFEGVDNVSIDFFVRT